MPKQRQTYASLAVDPAVRDAVRVLAAQLDLTVRNVTEQALLHLVALHEDPDKTAQAAATKHAPTGPREYYTFDGSEWTQETQETTK
jgi:hypothetical protein